MKCRSSFAGLICALVLRAQPAAPDATQLIERALTARKAQEAKGWQYTSREDSEEWETDSTGRLLNQSKSTWEHIMLEGGDYKKLILVNGKPLSAKAQKNADDDMEQERAERRRNPHPAGYHYEGSLDHLVRLFDTRVTGEETLSGRKAWRVEAEPKPGYRAASAAEEQLLAMRRVFWFDEQDGVEVRETGLSLKASGGLPAGSRLEIDYAKFGDAWLIDAVLFDTGHSGSRSHAYNYKRFAVDTTVTPQ